MISRDRKLGMDRAISRRDFLNGVSVALGASLLPTPFGRSSNAIQDAPYPPALTGMRGSHDGSWEVAHDLSRGGDWENKAADTGESYDLVVVGGGISGLSAAYFYRKAFGPESRILVLDNHDDFGGHAKRNEFYYQGRTFIGYGGTQSIDTPASYSDQAMGLLGELGVETERFYEAFDRELYRSHGLSRGVFFDKETFGTDRLVGGEREIPIEAFAKRTPLSPEAQRDLVRLYEEEIDYLPGISQVEKKRKLTRTSYLRFLEEMAKVHEEVLRFLSRRTHGLFGMGIDGVPALDCWALGYPGFQGLKLDPGDFPGLSATAKPKAQEPYIFHFPDGNASIARLLVRSLVPGCAPGQTMEDMVTARLDYRKLDAETQPVRIRLEATVVRVRQEGASAVEVTYVKGERALRVTAKRAVLACWHRVIPFLCPEMPQAQREALVYAPKVPLVYTNVFIRNWTAFEKLGVSNIYAPGAYHVGVSLDFPVSLGTYRHSRSPREPIVLHLTKTPCDPGGSSWEQHAAGRLELLSTSFETFERNTRDQLARMLEGGGFDPAEDILGITVNRWPHGYAYEYNSLWDPLFAEGESPCEIARKPFGRIHIANSDAQAYAYTDAAIDQAHRAIEEMKS